MGLIKKMILMMWLATCLSLHCVAHEKQPTRPTGRLKTRIDRRSGLKFVRLPKGLYPELPNLPANSTPENQKPPVTINPTWILLTDVTVNAYSKCALARRCPPDPESRDEKVPRCAWKNGLLSHPMNCVTWTEATQFCRWIGGRLPTATEWEYAATSGEPGKLYPWGETVPDAKHANYCDVNCPKALGTDGKNLVDWEKRGLIDRTQDDGWAATSPVGNYPAGATAWGLLDMAGNVWQWTSSEEGDGKHEVRGGSWDNAANSLRISNRLAWPDKPDAGMGFRCVKN